MPSPSTKTAAKPGYKQTEVGVIPEEWAVFRLSEHFRIYAGGDVPKHSLSDSRSETHPYPIFANALKNRGLYGFTGELRAKADSVTVTARGYLGHAEYREEPFFPIVRLLVLEPNGKLEAQFTTFAVNERVQFAFESTGVPQLTAPQIGKYSVAAPNIPEQHAVANALTDADAYIDSLQKLIAKKREVKQATMQQLLTGKKRLSGFNGEWEVVCLKSLGAFHKGSGIRKDEAQSGAIPCIRYGEIYTTHHNHIRKFTSWISRKVADAALRLQQGDLLFTCSGETKSEIGKCVALTRKVEAYAGGDIIVFKPNRGNSMFMGYYLNSPPVVAQKASRGQGDAVVHISASSLGSIELLLPDDAEQTAIAEVLTDMDSEIEALEDKLAKVRQIKQGMLQELLTGRIRLV